jgi:hypothetical protein
MVWMLRGLTGVEQVVPEFVVFDVRYALEVGHVVLYRGLPTYILILESNVGRSLMKMLVREIERMGI